MNKTLFTLMVLNVLLAFLGIMWSFDTYIWMGNVTSSVFLLMILIDKKIDEKKV